MAESQLGVLEVAQGDPAGEKLRIVVRVDRKLAGVTHKIVGGLHLAGLQRGVGIRAPLRPPAVRLDLECRFRLSQENLPRGRILVLAAQNLGLLHGEAPVLCNLSRRQLRHQLPRVLGAQEHGKARLGHLLLRRRQ